MKNSNNSMLQMLFALVIISGVVLLIMFMFQSTKNEVEVLITDNQIEIKGQYGTTINIETITNIILVDTIPSIGKKVNGAALDEFKKGDFEVEGLGVCRLFLHSNDGPFISIISEDKYYIINYKDASKTLAIFDKLDEVINK